MDKPVTLEALSAVDKKAEKERKKAEAAAKRAAKKAEKDTGAVTKAASEITLDDVVDVSDGASASLTKEQKRVAANRAVTGVLASTAAARSRGSRGTEAARRRLHPSAAAHAMEGQRRRRKAGGSARCAPGHACDHRIPPAQVRAARAALSTPGCVASSPRASGSSLPGQQEAQPHHLSPGLTAAPGEHTCHP